MREKSIAGCLLILFNFYAFLIGAENEVTKIDVKVNFLGDARAFYITQAVWLPDLPDLLFTIYFNSDNKTFWRYVINVYNPVSDVYTTLFEEQEPKNFYIKLFFFNKGELVFLKKFINDPLDTKDYVVFYDINKQKKTNGLLNNEKNKLRDRSNILNKEIKGRLVNCSKFGCLKIKDNKLLLVNEVNNKKIKEEFLLENVLNPAIISGTNLIIFKKQGEYFIYSIKLKKVLYKLNFIESYSKFKVDVVTLFDFDPQGKYILFETTGKYKGRNKKSVGILTKQIFK